MRLSMCCAVLWGRQLAHRAVCIAACAEHTTSAQTHRKRGAALVSRAEVLRPFEGIGGIDSLITLH